MEKDLPEYFGTADIVVFVGLLLASAAIGSYFAYVDRRNKSSENYYFGNRQMSSGPVAMSMAVSIVSAMTVIGLPVEVYLFGTVIIWVLPATALATLITAVYFIPFIYELRLKTIYEYLERRFHKSVRKLCSGINILGMVVTMGIIVYLPALALNAVTPLDVNWAIFMTSVICTFYTTVGGMKAVIWTDVLQGAVMIFGSLAVFVKAVILVGGFQSLASSIQRGHRNNFMKFDADLRIRSTALTIFGGMFINACVDSCCSQVYSQRYLSCKSVKEARLATILRVVPVALFMLLAVGNGLAMYAYYEGCDPTMANIIAKEDQTTPRMALEIFHDMPGMAGIFVSAAYSGTLSTVSSGINSLAALTLEDFIHPRWPDLGSTTKNVLNKGFSVLYGFFVMSVAYVTSFLDVTVIQMSMAMAGIIGGPILGVYTLGIFLPWTNSKGALSGLFIGWLMSAWISSSAIIYGPGAKFQETLPVSIEYCNITGLTPDVYSSSNTNNSFANLVTNITQASPDNIRPMIADTLYSLSPFLYGVLGFCVCFATGLIVSLATGRNTPAKADPDLFLPILDNNSVFPKSIIKFFRLGVPERVFDGAEKKSEEAGQF